MMLRASAMLAFVLAAGAFPAASSFLAYMDRAGGREGERGRKIEERERANTIGLRSTCTN